MNAGAACFPRRTRQGRPPGASTTAWLSIRYGKGCEPQRTRRPGGCIGVRCAPREIYRARRRVSGPGRRTRLVLLGDPPSFDEDDTDPHCCVKPLDAVALPSRAATAACRTRHGPAASCSAPMASRLRYLVTVYGPGCLPGHRDYLKRHDSLGFDAGRLLCPLVPREPSERLARPPPAVSDVHAARDRDAWRIGFDSPPPPVERAPWRIRAHAGASPAATPPYSRIASLRIGTSASAFHKRWLPRPRRISTGRLVSQSVGMAPDHAATGRLPHGCYDSASTRAAPEQSSYHPCRCCAQGRFSAPSLPHSRTGRQAAEGAFGRFGPPER